MSANNRTNRKSAIKSDRNPILPWLVFVVLLLIVTACVLFVLIKNHIAASKGSEYSLGINSVAGFDCDYSEAQRLYPFVDGLMKVTATRAAYITLSGTEIYSADFSMENPICQNNDKYIFVFDQEGYSCALFDEKGIIYQKHLTGKISYAAISSNGNAAVIMEQKDTKGSVIILSASGDQIAQWNSVESGYPVSLEYSENGNILSIALVDVDGSQMQPNLKQIFVPVDSSNETPYDLSFYSPNESLIMPSVAYISDDKLIWAGISKLFMIADGTLTEMSPQYANILAVFSEGNGCGIFYSNGIGQEICYEYIDESFNRGESIVLGNQLKAYSTKDNYLLVAVDDKLILIDVKKGKIDKSITVDEDIIRLHLTEKDKVILVTSSGVREINI